MALKWYALFSALIIAVVVPTVLLLTPGAALAASPAPIDPVQFLADVTLIDYECRTVSTVFGLAFQYAEEHGVHPVDIVPLGSRRPEFQAAYDRRLRESTRDQLCGPLYRRYDQEFPGLFTTR